MSLSKTNLFYPPNLDQNRLENNGSKEVTTHYLRLQNRSSQPDAI